LKNAQQNYQEADKRLDKTSSSLEGILSPGSLPQSLFPEDDVLPLPSVSSAKSGS